MPLDFCHVQASYGTRATAAPAVSKFDYITREGEYNRDDGEVLSVLTGNMPVWAGTNGRDFWKAADDHERANAVVWRQIEGSLPNECTIEQAEELAERFARTVAGEAHPFTIAIHAGHGDQLHFHFIWSDRMLDGIERTPEQFFKRANTRNPEKGGALKTTEPRGKDWIYNVRDWYAGCINEWQVEHGYEATVDPRSYAAQGLDLLPTVHEGFGEKAALAAEHNAEVRAHNADLVRLSEIEAEVAQLETDLSKMAAAPVQQSAVIQKPEPPELSVMGWIRAVWEVGRRTVVAIVDMSLRTMLATFPTGKFPQATWDQTNRLTRVKGRATKIGNGYGIEVETMESKLVQEPDEVRRFKPPYPPGLPAPDQPGLAGQDLGRKGKGFGD